MTNALTPPLSLGSLVGAGKGLAHPARLRMLAMLAGGELCVCQLIAVLGLAPSTVSQHLSVLARGGWVSERKEGKLVFYRISEGVVATALATGVLDLLRDDITVLEDAREVARLRRIAITELCAADLDLVAIGVREAAQLRP